MNLRSSVLLQRSLSCLLAIGLMSGCATEEEEFLLDEELADIASDDWGYLLKTDVGLRGDGAGLGYFLAPRTHGLHNGIDILGRVGEPMYSPCNGQVLVGFESSFGNWAQVVCRLPSSITDGQTLYASLFFAHMNSFGPGTSSGSWVSVAKGDQIGTIGRTGNAGSSNPHVHLEVVIHASAADARNEGHAGSDQSNTTAADSLLISLDSRCLVPNGFRATNGLRRARRVDPFVLLTCAGAAKPAIQRPSSSLQTTYYPWSNYYSATTFNVDTESLRPGGPVQPQYQPLEVYWARNADGSYKLHALGPSSVQRVEYFVDSFRIGQASRTDGSNFPDTYTFSQEGTARLFEVKGFDSSNNQVALGVGLIDVTAGTGVFIRQLGQQGYYDIGLERIPAEVAFIKVEVDGFALTDEITGQQMVSTGKVRYRFGQLGKRRVAISTFNADGTLRGTLHREFEFR